MRKGQKFQGSFEVQSKTLSQALKNISDKLTEGVFAKAGEVLSRIFVPILEKINDLLSNPWVEDIMGIVTALGLVLASIGAIKIALAGLKAGIISMAASGGLDGIVAAALVSIGAAIKGLFAGLVKYILIGVAGLVTFISGLPAAVIAAIIAVLSAASVMLINKLTTGDWFDIYGMILAVTNWFVTLSEKIINWFKGKGFRSDYEIDKSFYDKMRKNLIDAKNFVDELNERLAAFDRSLNPNYEEEGKRASERIEKLKERFAEVAAEIIKLSEGLKTEKNLERRANYSEAIKKYQEELLVLEQQLEESKLVKLQAEEAERKRIKEIEEGVKRAEEEERRFALKLSQTKFGEFTWYQDIFRKIEDGLKKTLPQDRIKDIEAKIAEFKKTFEHMTPEEQREAYKELGRMEL